MASTARMGARSIFGWVTKRLGCGGLRDHSVRWKVFSVLPAMSSYTRRSLSLEVVRRWYSVTRSGDIVGETNASESTSVELAQCVT